MPYLLVLSTAPSRKTALKLADLLLTNRVAACVNISAPLESHYWWKNKKEKAKEVLLFIKTKSSFYPKLEALIRKNHPYSVPEIIAIPIKRGSRPYLNWIAQETRIRR